MSAWCPDCKRPLQIFKGRRSQKWNALHPISNDCPLGRATWGGAVSESELVANLATYGPKMASADRLAAVTNAVELCAQRISPLHEFRAELKRLSAKLKALETEALADAASSQ